MVGPIGRSWWAWIAGSRPLAAADERVLRGFVPIADARLAVGLEAFGAEGFRSTHKQAIRAQAVAGKAPEPLTYFGDVAVTALASASLGDARAFVLHELRGIDQETPGDQRIRETILAYFAAGHNAASAAAALGVHQQTVTNRLLAAEERLGRSVASRRVELETALRLRSLLRAEPG
jgi:DNA-binding PucR family transcriptional regulator